jgi:hypothetical protein
MGNKGDKTMTFVKTLAVGTFLASTLIAGTAFAKGHNQGFGAGAAGPATAGQVDDGQKNLTGGREGSYGIRDQVPEVRENQAAGIHGNSDAARDKTMNHPSLR